LSTLLLPVQAPSKPALPFGQVGATGGGPDVRRPQDALPAVTDLSLEQYATFRAQLSIKGEEDAAVWEEFGVTSAVVKEALQARFAAQFRRDPASQAYFVDLVRVLVREIRAGGAQG
jgi:hypothetical protein